MDEGDEGRLVIGLVGADEAEAQFEVLVPEEDVQD